MADYHADKYIRNYAFRVEFSPGPAPDATHGKWKSFKGGGVRLCEEEVGIGTDKFEETTLAINEWEDITLVGDMTPERKDMLQWYKDMVEKGGEGECFRDVTLTFLDRQGNDLNSISWHECFMTSYSLTDLDASQKSTPLQETVVICTGYSDDYLK
jgi:hypothetical protein